MLSVTDYHQFVSENVLRPFQREIFDAIMSGPRVGVLGARQIGKSYIISYAAVVLGLGTTQIPGHDVLIISETEAKAKKLIADLNGHLDRMEQVCGKLRQPNRGGALEVVLHNGATITAKPGKPSALQAFSGSVLVDELSLTPHDAEELVAQALIVASAAEHFRTILVTNADVEGSFVDRLWNSFEASWTSRREAWKLLDFDVHAVFGDDLPDKLQQIRKAVTGPIWRRFYLNDFVSGASGAFDTTLIDATVGRELTMENPVTVIAYDPGFTKDPSGIVVARISDHIEVLEERVLDRWLVEDQLALIEELYQKHKPGRILYDVGVGGLVVGQELAKAYGQLAKPLSITRNFYERSAAAADRLLAEGKISIPTACRELLTDLATFERSDRGYLQVPRRKTKSGTSHCDVGVAFLMLTEELERRDKMKEPLFTDITHTHGTYLPQGPILF